jgi:hypothetical protein
MWPVNMGCLDLFWTVSPPSVFYKVRNHLIFNFLSCIYIQDWSNHVLVKRAPWRGETNSNLYKLQLFYMFKVIYYTGKNKTYCMIMNSNTSTSLIITRLHLCSDSNENGKERISKPLFETGFNSTLLPKYINKSIHD